MKNDIERTESAGAWILPGRLAERAGGGRTGRRARRRRSQGFGDRLGRAGARSRRVEHGDSCRRQRCGEGPRRQSQRARNRADDVRSATPGADVSRRARDQAGRAGRCQRGAASVHAAGARGAVARRQYRLDQRAADAGNQERAVRRLRCLRHGPDRRRDRRRRAGEEPRQACGRDHRRCRHRSACPA